MANYYSDHPEIGFYLNHPLMARIVELKEKGFADAKEYDYSTQARHLRTSMPLARLACGVSPCPVATAV